MVPMAGEKVENTPREPGVVKHLEARVQKLRGPMLYVTIRGRGIATPGEGLTQRRGGEGFLLPHHTWVR